MTVSHQVSARKSNPCPLEEEVVPNYWAIFLAAHLDLWDQSGSNNVFMKSRQSILCYGLKMKCKEIWGSLMVLCLQTLSSHSSCLTEKMMLPIINQILTWVNINIFWMCPTTFSLYPVAFHYFVNFGKGILRHSTEFEAQGLTREQRTLLWSSRVDKILVERN